jgi:hypothetical protein
MATNIYHLHYTIGLKHQVIGNIFISFISLESIALSVFYSFQKIYRNTKVMEFHHLYGQLSSTVSRSETSSPMSFKISIMAPRITRLIGCMTRFSAQTAPNPWANSLCKFKPAVHVALRRKGDQSQQQKHGIKTAREVARHGPSWLGTLGYY